MRFSATIFILFVFLSSVKSQATFRSEAILSNYSSRSTHFKLYVVGDSIMMASVGRYRMFQWTDYPRLLKSDSKGANAQVFDFNNVNIDCPVGRGTSWSNSKGYLLFSDTTTYAGYQDQTTLSQCFSYHAYGSDSLLWEGSGVISNLYWNRIAVASNSTFWVDNKISKKFIALEESTGDTMQIVSYDSIEANYPANSGFKLSQLILSASLETPSDSAYGIAHFIKQDSTGIFQHESFYGIIDLKNLKPLAPPIFWPQTQRINFNFYDFGLIKDSLEFYTTGNFYRKTITSNKLYSSTIDTVLVLDSLRYHPDTVKFPVHNRHNILRTKGEYTLYTEEIEQYLDTVQFGQTTFKTVLLRMYKGNNLVYENSLTTGNFSGDVDIRIVDAFVLSDGRAILNLNIGARRDGYRILFIDTNGTNYLSIDEQSIEAENTHFDILPNFVDHEIQIRASLKIQDLMIFDSMGREIKHFTPESKDFYINVSEFSPGLYYVKTKLFNATVLLGKFVKK